jgi:hypothetical protein
VRKHIFTLSRSQKRFHLLLLTSAIVTMAILAVGAATVVSRQKLSNGVTSRPAEEATRDSVTLNEAGQAVHFGSQSGQVKRMTAEEAEKLAAGLKRLVNQSTEGLVEVRHPDGSVSLSLDDHFQNVTVARINDNGSVSQSCVDNPQAAGAFFRIDPKLIENSPSERRSNEDR